MQNKSEFSWSNFYKTPVVGIVRGLEIDKIKSIALAYEKASFYTIEITMNTPEVAKIIRELRDDFPQLNVGAGTVCNLKELEVAINAGAQFIVTPIIDAAVIEKCVASNIPVFPGAYTPTEIYKAWSLGASAVKVFPATQLGSQYMKDILAPLNDIKLVPTGGVSLNNISSFFNAGVVGVGMGSSLIDKRMLFNNDYIALKNHFDQVRNEILSYCKK